MVVAPPLRYYSAMKKRCGFNLRRTWPLRTAGLLVLLLGAVLAVPGRAVLVADLYKASIPVTSRDNEREMRRAFVSGLQEVLIKVSGNPRILEAAPVRRALNDAQSFAESWEYRSEALAADGTRGGSETQAVNLVVTYFEPKVLSLLDDNQIPVWAENRPATLVWLTVEDELGERQAVGSASEDAVVKLFFDEARRLGLPLLFPVLDLEDRRRLPVDELWNLNEETIRAASQRYSVESILALRIYRSLSGELLGKYMYIFRERVLSDSLYPEDLTQLVREPVELTTRELSAYFAVLISGGQSDLQVNMTVEGVGDLQAYADLLNYLEQLAGVTGVMITRVDEAKVHLQLSTSGQLIPLLETIALDQQLASLGEVVRQNDQVIMRYQWRP